VIVTEGSSEPEDAPLTLYMIKRLELAIRAIMDDRLRPRGLTTLQYTALSVLRRRSDLSSAQLARRSFVRPQTMHQMILSLEARDLIQRRRDPHNRRVLLIRLTEVGQELLDECEPAVREIEAEMLGAMPREQREAFRCGLDYGYRELARVGRPGKADE
jgi:DNA-binding MarR family transcriptional regulator